MTIDGVESVLCHQSPPPGLKHPSSQLLTTQISVFLQNLALAHQIYPVQIMPVGFPTPSNWSVRGKKVLALNGATLRSHASSRDPCGMSWGLRCCCAPVQQLLLPCCLHSMGMLRDV